MPGLRVGGSVVIRLVCLFSSFLICIHAFSVPTPRYTALRDIAKVRNGLITPADIRSLVNDEKKEPVTRCELELVLPTKDRDSLLAAHRQEQRNEYKENLNVRMSLEAYQLAIAPDYNDVEATLERWRRVVAMRQNRVLNPGRAAQLYSQLISTMLCQDEFDFLRQVLQYVGLTSDVYLPADGDHIDLNKLCFHIAKITLDIDLERWRFEEEGRALGEPEPLSPKQRGENMAEWLWQQVMPPGGRAELEMHVQDMVESVLRVAFRHARDQGINKLTLQMQSDQEPPSRYHRIDERGLLLPRSSLELLRDLDAASLDLQVVFKEG